MVSAVRFCPSPSHRRPTPAAGGFEGAASSDRLLDLALGGGVVALAALAGVPATAALERVLALLAEQGVLARAAADVSFPARPETLSFPPRAESRPCRRLPRARRCPRAEDRRLACPCRRARVDRGRWTWAWPRLLTRSLGGGIRRALVLGLIAEAVAVGIRLDVRRNEDALCGQQAGGRLRRAFRGFGWAEEKPDLVPGRLAWQSQQAGLRCDHPEDVADLHWEASREGSHHAPHEDLRAGRIHVDELIGGRSWSPDEQPSGSGTRARAIALKAPARDHPVRARGDGIAGGSRRWPTESGRPHCRSPASGLRSARGSQQPRRPMERPASRTPRQP